MCGICGVIGGVSDDIAEDRLRRMMKSIVHRGPDDEGMLRRQRAMLGMRRLSIIDLAGGNQPVYNEDGDVGVVFNGEIYNFRELRAALEPRHRFRTHSDTEVIVHAYEEWGEDFLGRLRGMFAFALWDGRPPSSEEAQNRLADGRVILARDRLGIKPLYYTTIGGVTLFASEVRALLASGAVARRLAPEAVEAYLLFGSVVEPMTLIQDVFSLPPGHWLEVPCGAAAEIKSACYWDFAESGGVAAQMRDRPKDIKSAARACRPLLEEAVRSHLIADVPLGLFLSSGLDSTAIAALAARERSGLHTFTVVFPEQEFSEAVPARETATRLGCEHRELLVSTEEMQARLVEAVGALDQPSMDGINTFFVSWAARQAGLKVAVSGLGGDEVFGGYPTFRLAPRLGKIAAAAGVLPPAVRKVSARAFGGKSRASDAKRKLAAIWSDPNGLHPYFFSRMVFTPQQTQEFLLPWRAAATGAKNGNAEESLWRRWLAQVTEQAARFRGDAVVSWFEMRTYMADTLLRDTDAVSMHHSLEVRVPLLDHPLIEFVAGLPDAAKRSRGISKALLVEALSDLLPPEIVRKPKRTFTFPWQRWLHGALGVQVEAQLNDLAPSLAQLLDGRTVRSVWQAFLHGETGWARPWSLFVLNDWVRRHVDQMEPVAQLVRPAASTAVS